MENWIRKYETEAAGTLAIGISANFELYNIFIVVRSQYDKLANLILSKSSAQEVCIIHFRSCDMT